MRRIAYGFLYRQDVFVGNRYNRDLSSYNNVVMDKIISLKSKRGFLYGDALMAVTLVLLFLPTILYVLNNTLTIVQTAYINDYILQDTVACIEEGKAQYDSGSIPSSTDVPPSNGHNLSNIVFKRYVEEENVKGITLLKYTVQAIDNGDIVYELSTFLGPPLY